MNFYVEYKSQSSLKKAYEDVVANTGKTVYKAFLIQHDGKFSKKPYHYFRKKRIYDIEYVLFGTRGLKRAMAYLNLAKNPISLTLVLDRPLDRKSTSLLAKAKRTVKVIDRSGDAQNVAFYRACSKILFSTAEEDHILDADIMHIYKFYEPILQCKFSSCLGDNVYVDRVGRVSFCPRYPDRSVMGMLGAQTKYFESASLVQTLEAAIAKRESCKSTCRHFEHCMGACPLEDGCGNFPELFEKNAAYLDDIIANSKDLGKENYTVAKIVVKDRVYGE